ncbi:MAG: hypothetical protein J5679_03005, partial [Alphaproteobacteria bacterium]|nr:hypothetical protein [Alphaproteobacteria bacterium]
MKNSTKVGLVAMCLGASILVPRTCDYISEKKEDKLERQEEEQRRQEKELAAQKEAAEKARKEKEYAYFDKARDSLLAEMGYNKADVEKAANLRESAYEDDEAAWKLRKSSFVSRMRLSGFSGDDREIQQGMLYYDIAKMVAAKSAQYAAEVSKLLDKYNLRMPGAYEQSEEITKLAGIFEDCLLNNKYYDTPRLSGYINAQEESKENAKYTVATLMHDIGIMPKEEYSDYDETKTINWCGYGEARQDEVRAAVKNIIEKMPTDMDNAIVDIARKYAKYYPVLTDIKDIPAQYAECMKDICLWYEAGESGDVYSADLRGDLVITRSISVYDSKLPVNFFGEQDASYKLVSVEPGKWQVVRTDKNGKVSKTAVFTHDTDYVLKRQLWTDCKVGESSFSYEPGTNMGVHVRMTEVVYVKEREIKDDKLPKQEYDRLFAKQDARYDSLSAECERKMHLADSLRHKPDSIYWKASHIADDKLDEY